MIGSLRQEVQLTLSESSQLDRRERWRSICSTDSKENGYLPNVRLYSDAFKLKDLDVLLVVTFYFSRRNLLVLTKYFSSHIAKLRSFVMLVIAYFGVFYKAPLPP